MKTVIALMALHSVAHAVPEGTKVLKDLPYVTDGHASQKLDLYVPAKPTGPLYIYIHGGAWWGGSKDGVYHLDLLEAGYAVASVEYRFSQDAVFPAQIQDCKAAVRWLRAHAKEYGYDPARIAVCGDSAGGHLTAMLATTGDTKEFDVGENLDQSSAITCGIDYYGPTDFVSWQPASKDPMIQRGGKGSCLEQLFGGPVDEKTELAKSASPVTWVTKDDAPLLIFHGTEDPLVKVRQSELLVEDYKEAGVEVELDVIEGAGHGGAPFWSDGQPERIRRFLARHLDKNP
ncbi:alpha/beta hydrolase [Luteolibacter marinus]|uniref:alpha/beta hydrolase n=1 Tax=Luteolibacter marinus TaxID=2776705 RepID=UPI0018688D45|nr:alpha/beta hydrolase [Luteolibacter marinus]